MGTICLKGLKVCTGYPVMMVVQVVRVAKEATQAASGKAEEWMDKERLRPVSMN